MRQFDSLQVPIIITSYSGSNFNKLFTIDPIKLLKAVKANDLKIIESLVDNLWLEYFNYLMENPVFTTIFGHNLGSFDGFFLYKALLKLLNKDQVKALIDTKNSFISITYENAPRGGKKFIWKDSYRIFPVSLKDLCKNFNVIGKSSDYNEEFNYISVFNKSSLLAKFLEYSKQDSKGLFDALLTAQDLYFNEHKVDITSIFSTSTLSLKIFRT